VRCVAKAFGAGADFVLEECLRVIESGYELIEINVERS
jgi:hypothetical protein